jgi:hypothetical protein
VFESSRLGLAESERAECAAAEEAAADEADASDYRPELATADLIIEVRRLLTTERRAERLICRYLADMADRIRARSDRELDVFLDEFDAAKTIFGLGARETRERIRIGRALRQLPGVEHAFIAGDVSYSRVREVTRVAQPDTESDWLELAQSLDMRALERRVASATREAAAARAIGDGTAGEGPGAQDGWAGECNGWTSADAVGGASADENRPRNDLTNGASAIRALSHRADDNDNASCPGQRRHVRACTEWTGRDSVRVTFELSAEAWAMVERALEGVRRRAAVTAVREGEALEGDRQGDPAARSEGMAILGVAPLDDGEALEALARDALSLRSNEADVLASGGLHEVGCSEAISRATQGGSSTVATALLQIIGRRGGWTIDDLIDQSGLGVTEVQHGLLLLEVDHRIRRRCNEIDPI